MWSLIPRLAGNVTSRFMSTYTLDPAQIRASDALRQWLLETRSTSKRLDHVQGEVAFANPAAASTPVGGSTEEERKVEEYVRKLALENAAMLKKKTGKDTPLLHLDHESSFTPPKIQGANHPVQQPEEIKRRSIYLYGSVGRGKSMLMNQMVNELQSTLATTRATTTLEPVTTLATTTLDATTTVLRVHFSTIMKEVHRKMIKEGSKIETIANELADKYENICIDEVVVSDVQDAVVFVRLLSVLLKRQVAMIMTSNKRPELLYEGGLNRHLYMPGLVTLLRQGCRLVNLDWTLRAMGTDLVNAVGGEGKDYREGGNTLRGQYVSDEHEWAELWNEGEETEMWWQVPGSETRGLQLKMKGKKIMVEYEEVFKNEKVGEYDYVELGKWLKEKDLRCFVGGRVNKFDKKTMTSEARLFGKFVEVMYDAQVPLVVWGETREPKDLFEDADKVQVKGVHVGEMLSAASRAISRLNEIR